MKLEKSQVQEDNTDLPYLKDMGQYILPTHTTA